MSINIYNDLSKIGKSEKTPYPGSFVLGLADIEHGTGARYPIIDLITEIHLFEDIEKMGITGWVQIRDNVNLIRNGIVSGEELLWLKFITGGAEQISSIRDSWEIDFSEHPLYIHKMEEIVPSKGLEGNVIQSVIQYRLHFCSTELIMNDRLRFSRTYKGPSAKVIKDIMTKPECGVETQKNVTVANTIDNILFIAPNWHPYDIINEVSQFSQAETNEQIAGPGDYTSDNLFMGKHTDFLFFETSTRKEKKSGGFFFIPLQRYDWGDVGDHLDVFTFTLGSTPISKNYRDEMLTSINYEYLTTGDKWKSVSNGSWASKEMRYNIATKSMKTYESNYLDAIKEKMTSHISETPVYARGTSFQGKKKRISDFPNANVGFNIVSETAQGTSASFNEIFKGGTSLVSSYLTGSWLGLGKSLLGNLGNTMGKSANNWSVLNADTILKRKLQMNHLLNFERIECEFYGLSGLRIGIFAKMVFPRIGLGSGEKEQTGIGGSKDILKGKNGRDDNWWLITKVAHHIVVRGENPNYTTTVELANTMMDTDTKLPTYDGMGNIQTRNSFF